MQSMVGRNKNKDELGISDVELEPYQSLFDAAYVDIDKGKSKTMVINNLARDLSSQGYPENKACRAITKKLALGSLKDGKKYANADYIGKVLPSQYKDYVHGKKRTMLEIEKQDLIRQQEKEKKLLETAKKPVTTTHPKPLNEKLMKGIEADMKKEIETAKENGIEAAIELEEEEEEQEPEIEITESESETDTIIDVPAPAVKGPTIKEKTQEMQQELNMLQAQLDTARIQRDEAQDLFNNKSTAYDTLEKDYAKLLADYNEAIKPFMERQWIQVNTLNPETGEKVPSIVEFDIVANAITRRIKIPKDKEEKKIYFKRRISSLQEKEEHEAKWKKITKGKFSMNVKIVKPNDDESMTASELQE